MDNLNKRAVTEVIEVLNHTEKDIVDKIPKKFIKFLFENGDTEYKPDINFYDSNWESMISEDAQAILALIYRDYIVSESERNELLKEEQETIKEQEEKLREKYNPDNLFKKKTQEKSETVDNMQLVEIKELPWYKKILEKIFKVFGRK